MANKKKEVYRPKPMTEGKKAVIQGLLDEYDIQSAEDIQDALKDLLSGTIQTMLETEMGEHLGYEKYARDDEPNYRNGTKPKTVRSKYGEFEVDVPQDRNSTFEPAVVKKRQKDISGIEEQVIAMYANSCQKNSLYKTSFITFFNVSAEALKACVSVTLRLIGTVLSTPSFPTIAGMLRATSEMP